MVLSASSPKRGSMTVATAGSPSQPRSREEIVMLAG
jgi:hypothetical protein